jgi:uncharacterized protein
MNFREREVVITGASSGIGSAFADYFAARGARLTVCGRRVEVLERRRSELLAAGATSVHLLAGDLADEQTVTRILARVRDHPVSALINNAGFGYHANLAEADPEHLRAMLRVQAEAPLRLAHTALAGMAARGEGLLINVGSLAGRAAVPGSALYVSTKVYLERLSETLAIEMAPAGVVVQALVPGYVRTDFHRDVENLENRRRNRGLVRWMDSDAVVARSMRAAERSAARIARKPGRIPRGRDVVVVPGLANRVLARIAALVPRTMVYRAASKRRPV